MVPVIERLFFKDFATPSLNCCDRPVEAHFERGDDVADDDEEETVVVQLSLRRHWETRYDVTHVSFPFKTLRQVKF